MATPEWVTKGESGRRNSSGLARDIEILEVLADLRGAGDGMGVVRLAEILGRDKATVSRALATLADAGLLTRDPESMLYHIGPRVYALAARSTESTLARHARPFLRHITRQTRETSHLSVLRGGLVLTLVSELSQNEVRTASWEGRSADALQTPSGRVLVSDWPDDDLADWCAEQRSLRSANTVATPARSSRPDTPEWLEAAEPPATEYDLPTLIAAAEGIRAVGYATSDEEFEAGVVAASAPVRDQTGRIIAAVNVSAPKSRIGRHLDPLGRYVARAAQDLSRHLGAPPRVAAR
jgi:DNA-binding IclR family transcriptional regulator